MEGPSVLGPCSWQRRRAWARHSRDCRSPEGERDPEEEEEEEEEEEAAAVPWEPPEPDRAVLEGRLCCRVRPWLQDCGALQDRHLSPGDSTASGVPSSVPSRSSVAAALAWRQSQSDAEEILLALGFVGSEPGAASRVPPRFFSGPSRASGIDLGLFLRAQARRLQLEDPGLRLASRFQQVQALAATADAFLCLYSHVSRTPLQRIAPAPPCRDIPDSAGRRLKRAVSSLCLYTGRGHGGDTPRGATPGPGGTPEGCRGHGDTDTVSPGPPRVGTAWGHPEGWRGHGDTDTVSPRPPRVGTAWGHPEGWRGHGDTDTVSPGPPRVGTAWGHPEGWRGHGDTDTVSPRPPRVGTAWGHPEGWRGHGDTDTVSPGPPRVGTAWGHPEGWRGHGDTDTVSPRPPRVGTAWGHPEGWRGHGDTDTVSPGPPRVGTAWGHPQRCCPRGRGVWGRGGDTGDPRGDVTASCRAAGTAQRPPGLRPPRQPGLGSRCHPGHPARAGGHRAGRAPEPPETPETPGAAESFELEEVPSEEEEDDDDEDDDDEDDEDDDDDDDDDDDPEEATRSPHPFIRSSLLHGRSDSSGFGEEPLPTL